MLPVASNGLGISERKWFKFTLQWENYKMTTGLLESEIHTELIYCLEPYTFSSLISVLPTAKDYSEALLLSTLQDIAVQKTNKAVLQHEFTKLVQDHTKSVLSFISTLKSKVRECGFNVKCKYCDKHGHTEEICQSKHGNWGIWQKGMHFANEACHEKQRLTREKREEKKREIQQEPEEEELNNVYKIQ